jgi:phosphate transport system ATP-binding protein
MDQAVSAGDPAVRAACDEAVRSTCTAELHTQDGSVAPEKTEPWWPNPGQDPVAELSQVSVSYDGRAAVRDVSFPVPGGSVVALIGPSGAGKSTLLRCINRLNDLVPGTRIDGKVLYRDVDVYGPSVDPIEVRRRIGMVFQAPNPFPKSIYDNVAFGPRIVGVRGDLGEIVERALRRAALWDEVRDRLSRNAYGLSGGQQQRLVIARALAIDPE